MAILDGKPDLKERKSVGPEFELEEGRFGNYFGCAVQMSCTGKRVAISLISLAVKIQWLTR